MTPSPPPSASSPKWGIEQRLAYIGSHLAWERRINRSDLVARFGISPNQATADIRRFAEVNPGALVYDGRGKTYRAGADWSRPDDNDAAALLRELRLIAESLLPETDGLLQAPPPVALAEGPLRPVPPAVLAGMIEAIRHRLRVRAVYQSFSTPEPTLRRLEPHALVFDGFRWHARARDVDEDRFKDFVLGRLSEVGADGPAATHAADDGEWNRLVRLEIAPHPDLAPHQRAAIASDYGMTEGRLILQPRAAVAYYVKRRLGLTDGHERRPPREQHITLVSEE